MPRPPHDRQEPTQDLDLGLGPDPEAEDAWPSSVTELQRRAQERSARDARHPDPDDGLATGRLRARQGPRLDATARRLAETRRADPGAAPEYRESLDVRAGQAIVTGVRRAGGRTLDYLRNLSGQRLWTMVVVALAGGALVGAIAAFGMRRALSDRPGADGAAATAAVAGGREPGAARDLDAPSRPREPVAARDPDEPARPREPVAARDPDEPARPRDPPPPRAPAPPPAALTLGARAPATLVIVSDPFGADIAVNGQATGLKTPDTVEGLAPGRTYKVTLTRKGYRQWEEDLDVPVGGPRQVSARLEKTGKTRAPAAPRRRR